jgi:ArsR family metal-binding transcriptional regulator
MFLEEIKVLETSPCLADETLFKGLTRASVSLNELLPYLNSMVEKANYQPNLNSLTFKKGKVGFTLQDTSINLTRFANMTELYELLDWVKILINDTYTYRADITPNYKARKIVSTLAIYNLLPKKNCKECGEPSCMGFAAKLNKFDVEIDDCPMFQKNEFTNLREKLRKEMDE